MLSSLIYRSHQAVVFAVHDSSSLTNTWGLSNGQRGQYHNDISSTGQLPIAEPVMQQRVSCKHQQQADSLIHTVCTEVRLRI
jgi:hypothetical protein